MLASVYAWAVSPSGCLRLVPELGSVSPPDHRWKLGCSSGHRCCRLRRLGFLHFICVCCICFIAFAYSVCMLVCMFDSFVLRCSFCALFVYVAFAFVAFAYFGMCFIVACMAALPSTLFPVVLRFNCVFSFSFVSGLFYGRHFCTLPRVCL